MSNLSGGQKDISYKIADVSRGFYILYLFDTPKIKSPIDKPAVLWYSIDNEISRRKEVQI